MMENEKNQDIINHLKRYIVDYRNYEGFMVLTRGYQISGEEAEAFMRSQIPFSNSQDKQFDIHSLRYLTLEEWINSKLQKPTWFKRILRHIIH